MKKSKISSLLTAIICIILSACLPVWGYDTATVNTGTIEIKDKDNTAVSTTYSGDIGPTSYDAGIAILNSESGKLIIKSSPGLPLGTLEVSSLVVDDSSVDVGDAKITVALSSNSTANGITVTSSSDFKTQDIQGINVTANGSSTGIYASGSSVDITEMGNIKATATGENGSATGINADNSTVSIGSAGSVDVTGTRAAIGLYASESSVDITEIGNIKATATGENGDTRGIWANNSTVSIGSAGSVDVTGTLIAFGLTASGSSVDITEMGNINAAATGENGSASGINAENSTVSIGSAGSVDATGTLTAIGLLANDASINITQVGNINVTATSENGMAYGLLAANAGVISVTGAGAMSSIAVSGSASNSAAIEAENGGTVNITNFSVTSLNGVNSVWALDGAGTVNASGSILNGNIAAGQVGEYSSTVGNLTLSLSDRSTLNGAAAVMTDGSSINLSVGGAGLANGNTADNSGVWNVTGNSDLGTGTLSNSGIVSFKDDGADNSKTVTAGRLDGQGGLLVMNAVGDKIVAVNDGSNFTGQVLLNNTDTSKGSYKERMSDALVLVSNTDGSETTDITLVNKSKKSNTIELGSWSYALTKGATQINGVNYTEWYMRNAGLSNMAYAALTSVLTPDIWYIETGMLYSEMGGFTKSRPDSSTWMRAVYSKTDYSGVLKHDIADLGDNDFTQKYYGGTGGYDRRISSGEKGDFFAGLMFGYGTGDVDRSYGDTTHHSFHAGLYGIYRATSGWYAAGVLKYNRYDTDLNYWSDLGVNSTADVSQNGWGLSAMVGRQFAQQNGFYWEPQLELGWYSIGGEDYTLGSDKVSIDDQKSLRGRLGVAFGRKYQYANGAKMDLYVKAAMVHEFDGETDVYLNSERFKTDYSGTWGQYGVGIDYQTAGETVIRGALNFENGGGRKSPIGVELGITFKVGPGGTKSEDKAAGEKEAGEAPAETPEAQAKEETPAAN